jgi:hypothetical protein
MRSLLVLVIAAVAAQLVVAAPGGAAARTVLIGAAGDIACDPASPGFDDGDGTAYTCAQLATSNLLVAASPNAVLALGDEQYECGGLAAFRRSYAPSWGRLRSITRPVIGNHEYYRSGGTDCDPTGSASGYFSYFGSRAGDPQKGYYSYNLGAWHLIALNSNCDEVGCYSGSAQEQWLKADLAAHKNKCTAAYWHHPRWTSGGEGDGNATWMSPLYKDLYNANADLLFAGHDHDYERFAPQNPTAGVDKARGIREFVVGTGGKNHHGWGTFARNSEVRNNTTYGVLRLALKPSGYDFKFVPEPGASFTDSGSGACH